MAHTDTHLAMAAGPTKLTDEMLLKEAFPKAMLYGTRKVFVEKSGHRIIISIAKYAVANTSQLWDAIKEDLGLQDGDIVGLDVILAGFKFLPEKGLIGGVIGMPIDESLWAAVHHPEAICIRAKAAEAKKRAVPNDLIEQLRGMRRARAQSGDIDDDVVASESDSDDE